MEEATEVAAVVLSPAAGFDEDTAADELAVTWKLFEAPSVVVTAADSLTELATSGVDDDDGNDCPLAGIGTMLVDVALDAAATLVCEA
jgi:hypothetical protein